jgi:hypothetical protein
MLNVLLHGIGSAGDNANPTNSSSSNKNPIHKTRPVSVLLYENGTNNLVKNAIGDIVYDPSSGSYKGTVDLGSIPSASYIVRIKTDQYLRNAILGSVAISPGQKVTLPTMSMVSGDVNNDNALDILDYNILISCYADLAPAGPNCTASQGTASDLTDDGKVNQFDYNLFLRELSVQAGQ